MATLSELTTAANKLYDNQCIVIKAGDDTSDLEASVVQTDGTASGGIPFESWTEGWKKTEKEGWNFAISKTFLNNGYNVLKDAGATYCPTYNINMFSLQAIDDNTLQFGAPQQGHSYIWKFETGHSFEVDHLESTYASRAIALASYKGSWLTPDGTRLYHSIYDGSTSHNNRVLYRDLVTPFDLTTAGSEVKCASLSSFYRMQWSNDGMHLIAKNETDNVIYHYSLKSAWKIDSADDYVLTTASLSAIESATWRSFCFNEDGTQAVFTSGNGIGKVHHMKLSTPWDVTTMSRTEAQVLFSSGAYLDAVVVNKAGTKMILFENSTDKLYTYNLTQTDIDLGIWDFDLQNAVSSSYKDCTTTCQNQQLVYGCELDGNFNLLFGNFLNNTFKSIVQIPQDENEEYHVKNAGSQAMAATSPDSSHYYIKCSSKDGLNLYWINSSTTASIVQQTLTAPFDSTTVVSTKESPTLSVIFQSSYFDISENGKYIYILDAIDSYSNGVKIRQFEMTTPFDISTLDKESEKICSLSLGSYYKNGIRVSPDGKTLLANLYSTGTYKSRLVKLRMSVPFDISTATLIESKELTLATNGVVVSPDCKCLFMQYSSQNSGRVYEYQL